VFFCFQSGEGGGGGGGGNENVRLSNITFLYSLLYYPCFIPNDDLEIIYNRNYIPVLDESILNCEIKILKENNLCTSNIDMVGWDKELHEPYL